MRERAFRSILAVSFLGALVAFAGPGCGSNGDGSVFGPGSSGSSGGSSGDPPSFLPGDGGSSGSSGGDAKPCTGLCLRQKNCGGGATTSLSGSVYDPAGRVPLYNVVVYVPNAPLAPIASGATCDQCGAVSGDPLVATLTDSSGNFKLDNVPVGKDIPLVMQVGKWRRAVTLPVDVQECKDNPLTAANLKDVTRLPKNHNEGNIPLMALTTGGADALECLLRKIGIEDSEFSVGGGAGRIQFFAGHGGSKQFDASHGGSAFGATLPFWSSADNLKKYDIVLLSCEGTSDPPSKPQAALDALGAYTDAGGRVFASHWHRYWLWSHADGNGPLVGSTPFQSVGTWQDAADPPSPSTGTIDDTFPKGKAMKEWLASPAVGASTVPGQLSIQGTRDNISSVDKNKAQQWITLASPQTVEYLSFNTPQSVPDDKKCGRVVYSDLHVSSGVGDRPGKDWPSGCTQPTLSPQEKALEFMLFDLSSCIQSDSQPPSVPGGPTVK